MPEVVPRPRLARSKREQPRFGGFDSEARRRIVLGRRQLIQTARGEAYIQIGESGGDALVHSRALGEFDGEPLALTIGRCSPLLDLGERDLGRHFALGLHGRWFVQPVRRSISAWAMRAWSAWAARSASSERSRAADHASDNRSKSAFEPGQFAATQRDFFVQTESPLAPLADALAQIRRLLRENFDLLLGLPLIA